MSIFLWRCNHSVNVLIVALITQTRGWYLFCSFQIARFQISSPVTMAGSSFLKWCKKKKKHVGQGGEGAKLHVYLFLLYSVRSPLYSVYILRYSHRKDMTNLHTQMSSNQSEKRTMFFTREKKKCQSQSRTMFFQGWEKWYVQSKATEVCEFRARISAFYKRLQLAAPSLCELFRKDI